MREEIKYSPEEIIWKYHQLHQRMYAEHSLKSLSGLNNEYKLNGRELLIWHGEATRKCSIKYSGQFNYWKNLDNILFCSEEILYYTSSLFLYRPYINNPLKEAFCSGGTMIYPNYQNHYAKRYSMFTDVVCQCVYNYWDRIGDLIASFFPTLIAPSRVFFTTVIDIIPQQFHSSQNYIWLNNFRKIEFKQLNEMRKQIVHYSTSETDYKHLHLDNGGTDREEMVKIQAQRESLPEFYKSHIELTLIGMEKTLLLLEEISNSLFTDIS